MSNTTPTVLVTGSAGFVGSHVVQRLLARGDAVVGMDNHNAYYDPALKEARLARFADHPAYTHHRLDLADRTGMADLFARYRPSRVVHLAAQAGVRYSIDNPLAYIDSNIVGFAHILEGCRHHGVHQLRRDVGAGKARHDIRNQGLALLGLQRLQGGGDAAHFSTCTVCSTPPLTDWPRQLGRQ